MIFQDFLKGCLQHLLKSDIRNELTIMLNLNVCYRTEDVLYRMFDLIKAVDFKSIMALSVMVITTAL